jgi:hypothetical protein
MILDIARAHTALRKCSGIRRQWWTVPRGERDIGCAANQEAAGGWQNFPWVKKAVPLRAETVYPSLKEDKLHDEKCRERDMDEEDGAIEGHLGFREA